MTEIEQIESRFKYATGLCQELDMTVFPLPYSPNQQQKTTKEENKKFGFVCTPLWMVDHMISRTGTDLTLDQTTCDACSGCGQFTIRLMRYLYEKFPDMDVNEWLENKHWFTEFQFSNIAKLIYIFGPYINVYCGDSLNLGYSGDDDHGIMIFDDENKKWFSLAAKHPQLFKMIEHNSDNLDVLIKLMGRECGEATQQGGRVLVKS